MPRTRRESHLHIQTPEGVTFAVPLAGPIRRFLAAVIDIAAISFLSSLLSLFVAFLAVISADLVNALGIITGFVLYFGYTAILEYFWNGQTIGKRVLGLRVADIHGLRLQFVQVLIRSLFKVVDMLPLFYLVGGVSVLLTRHSQRLGDLAANTVVLHIPDARHPDLSQVLPTRYNSLREYPLVEARLRQGISPELAMLIAQALFRRDILAPEARLRLYGELAAHTKALTPLPESAIAPLTDEQLLRNLLDTLQPRSAPIGESR